MISLKTSTGKTKEADLGTDQARLDRELQRVQKAIKQTKYELKVLEEEEARLVLSGARGPFNPTPTEH